jgi:hypothetical protein
VSDQVGVDGAGSDPARSGRLGPQRGGSDWAGSDWAEAERAASEWAGIESLDTHRDALDGPASDRPGSGESESGQPGPGRPETEESAFGGPAFDDVGSDPPGAEEPGHDGSESDSSGTGRQGSDQSESDRPEFGGPGFRERGFGGPQFGAPVSGGGGSDGAEFESVGSGPTRTPPAGQPFPAMTREPGSELRPGPRPIPADRAPRPTAGRVPPHRDLASAVRLLPPGEADAANSGAEEHRSNPPERVPQPAVAELPQRRRRDPVDGTGPLQHVGEPEPTGERRHRYLLERDAAAGTSAAGPLPNRGESGNTEPLAIRAPLGRPVTGPAERSGAGRPASAPDSSTPGAVEDAAGPAELGLRPESVARLSASGRELLARLQAELQGGPQLGSRPGGHSPNGSTGPQARVDPPDLAG